MNATVQHDTSEDHDDLGEGFHWGDCSDCGNVERVLDENGDCSDCRAADDADAEDVEDE